jgi:hypothetical protein
LLKKGKYFSSVYFLIHSFQLSTGTKIEEKCSGWRWGCKSIHPGEEEETKIRPEGGKVPAAVLVGEKGAAERERGRGEVLVGGAVWVPSVFWPKSEQRRWGECWLFE